MEEKAATKGFYKLCLSTLVAIYFLIAVGGIVRSTGSGMGCPDWPKCFGQWIPPTSVDQLPSDYKESYAQYRAKKNQKFTSLLRAVGMSETADKILADKTVLIEADFNSTKTLIEYLNRVLGVIIGLFIVALFWRSLKFRKQRPALFWVSVATLLAVLVQGWFGSIVVSTNLTTWTITVHMLIALVIVSMLNYLLAVSLPKAEESNPPSGIIAILICCSVALLIQILFGTQVREAIDKLALLARDTWIASLGLEFIIHRSFSWIVLGLHVLLIWRLRKTTSSKTVSLALFVLILGSFLTGVGMAYFDVPPFLQPLHLVLAAICFGFQQFLFFKLNSKRAIVLN
jgi:heme a synthase